MDNLIKDLKDIYSLWTFNFLSKLEYDGNGTYSISKEKIDVIKSSILNNNLNKEETRLINSQASRLIVSLMSEDIIK